MKTASVESTPSQSHATDTLRAGWHRLPPEPLPLPTYWPAVLAAGLMALAGGLVTSLVLLGAGVVLIVIAAAGWIQDLEHADT